MTLCIRVVTSLGMVLVADSLVTTSRRMEVITDSDKKYYLNNEQAESIFPGWPSSKSPPVLVDRTYLNTEQQIASTSPNVKKIHDFSELNIAFSFAGAADFEYCYIRHGGFRRQSVPPDLAVKTVVKESLDLTFDESIFASDLGECISIALTTSLIKTMRNRKRSFKFSLIGGGYSKHNPFPDTFDYNLDIKTGAGRFDILDGVSRCLSRYLKRMVPMYCTSRNWFEEFIKHELDNLVSYCITDAIWWSFIRPFSASVITNQIIPDIEQHVILTLKQVDRILSDNKEINLYEKDEVKLPDVIKIAFEMNREDNWSYESLVSESFSNHKEYVANMIEYYESNTWDEFKSRAKSTLSEIVISLDKKSYSIEAGGDESFRDRLPSEQKAILSEQCFNTLYFILSEMIPRTTLATSMANPSYDWIVGGEGSVGITHIGQGDVLQRIIYGLDESTRRNMSSEIRDFQMHATKRFTQLLTARLKSVDAPEPQKFKFYQSDKRDSATSYTEPPSLSKKSDNSIETKLFDFDNSIEIGSKTNIIDGKWKGKFSLTRVDSDGEETNNLYNCRIELRQLSDEGHENQSSSWAGSGSVDKAMIELGHLSWDGNAIEFRMRIKEHDEISEEEYFVEGKMTEWGLDCFFTTSNGSREHLLLTKDDDEMMSDATEVGDGIDSETIQSVLSELYSELEEFEPPKESYWDIDYINMPLENAVDLARYLMESTIRKQQFNSEIPTVGGPIVTIKMTKDDGIVHV